MAGRIQGITVEIGGDTTKLQTALKGVNTEIRNTQSQLRDVDKLLKLDPGNKEFFSGLWEGIWNKDPEQCEEVRGPESGIQGVRCGRQGCV